MAEQDWGAKRREDEADKEFQETAQIHFLSDRLLNNYYEKVRKQLQVLFWMNITICVCAFVAILAGIILAFSAKTEIGVVLSVSGILIEILSNIFIRQYEHALRKVSDEYFRFLMCNNLEQALNLAIKLPLTDARNTELRYLEIRELLRPIKNGFNEYLSRSK
ncbi:hypothetical protein LJC27_06270 [Christensenellaceae bacterium OttesenSCG-928-M15]|nr:hypothetical protein [Christensenellaceae bacterium OttesenSCG-928-M15]